MSHPRKPPTLAFAPRNPTQEAAARAWPNLRACLLVGGPGTGKTALAVACALRDLLAPRGAAADKVILCRPTVPVGEDIGHLPGDVGEKLGPWLGPFRDVLGDLSDADLDDLIGRHAEVVPVGMLRGRTVKRATLIVDEAQNLTPAQVLCCLTRVGDRGRVALAGDPSQADTGIAPNPLADAARRLRGVPGVGVFRFRPADQVRDPFVTAVAAALTP